MTIPTIAILTDAVTATAAISAARFVTRAGAHSAAGGYAVGVSRSAGAIGDMVPTDVLGTAEVESGGAFADGDPLMSDASGRAVLWTSPNKQLARAFGASGAAGKFVEVHLIPN
jgi:hypothetical protein